MFHHVPLTFHQDSSRFLIFPKLPLTKVRVTPPPPVLHLRPKIDGGGGEGAVVQRGLEIVEGNPSIQGRHGVQVPQGMGRHGRGRTPPPEE